MKSNYIEKYTVLKLSTIFLVLWLVSTSTLASDTLTDIKLELEQLKSDYESRLQTLETRLLVAEQKLIENNSVPVTSGRNNYAAASNQYNPALGIILDTQLWSYSKQLDDRTVAGFLLGGESAIADEGIHLGESEFVFTGNVDNWFFAQLTAAIEQDEGDFEIGLEEAFVETLSLPAGATLRLGRFYSGIGYQNDRHKHVWDFADQSLPYRAFLGSQYGDDGVQFRWLAPTDFYLELGAEVFSGSNYPAAAELDNSIGSSSLFVRSGGDVGSNSSWTGGLSWLGSDVDSREFGETDKPSLFNGDSDIVIADFVWKWAPNGNSRQRNAVFQAEYLWRNETGNVFFAQNNGLGTQFDQNSTGWYAQAVYQWMPRWRAGVRVDKLDADPLGPEFVGTEFDSGLHSPQRYSFMLDYSNSEFSRFRFQFNRDESGLVSDNQFGIQYIMSIGAHGGHEF